MSMITIVHGRCPTHPHGDVQVEPWGIRCVYGCSGKLQGAVLYFDSDHPDEELLRFWFGAGALEEVTRLRALRRRVDDLAASVALLDRDIEGKREAIRHTLQQIGIEPPR